MRCFLILLYCTMITETSPISRRVLLRANARTGAASYHNSAVVTVYQECLKSVGSVSFGKTTGAVLTHSSSQDRKVLSSGSGAFCRTAVSPAQRHSHIISHLHRLPPSPTAGNDGYYRGFLWKQLRWAGHTCVCGAMNYG